MTQMHTHLTRVPRLLRTARTRCHLSASYAAVNRSTVVFFHSKVLEVFWQAERHWMTTTSQVT